MAFRAPETTDADRVALAPRAGQCATCVHLQVLRSKRSVFVRCARAESDPYFPRYPVVPVVACPGYEEEVAPDG